MWSSTYDYICIVSFIHYSIFSERYYPHFIDKEFMRLRDRAGTVAKPTDTGNSKSLKNMSLRLLLFLLYQPEKERNIL